MTGTPIIRRQQSLQQLGWGIWSLCVVLSAVSIVFFIPSKPLLNNITFPGFYGGLSLALVYGTVGLLIIARRPYLPFGWLFMSVAVPAALMAIAQTYALYGFFISDGEYLPGLRLAGWLQLWVIYLAFPAPIALLCMLFPDGRLLSPRWRWAAWLALLSTVLLVVNEMLSNDSIPIYITEPPIYLPMNNPTRLTPYDSVQAYVGPAWLLAIFMLPLGFLALVLRFRSAQGVVRQQLKWFVYFSVVGLAVFPFAFTGFDWISGLLLFVVLVMLPTGTTISIFRYRLYDIDIIIRRTLSYAVLTGTLAGVYFSGVVLLQALFRGLSGETNSPLITVLSTLAIAALFNPLRLRIQDFIDRRFYRARYNAEATLAHFSITARDEVDVESLSVALLGVVDETMQPERISLWLKTDRREPAA